MKSLILKALSTIKTERWADCLWPDVLVLIVEISKFWIWQWVVVCWTFCPEMFNHNSGHFSTQTILPVLSGYFLLLFASWWLPLAAHVHCALVVFVRAVISLRPRPTSTTKQNQRARHKVHLIPVAELLITSHGLHQQLELTLWSWSYRWIDGSRIWLLMKYKCMMKSPRVATKCSLPWDGFGMSCTKMHT